MTASVLRLVKYEGAGNDFLVHLDPAGDRPLAPDVVRALCDRHHGVGADGVLRLLGARNGADVQMELFNADGTRAEMSGNGVRCLAHAALDAGLVSGDQVSVETDAGIRVVTMARRRWGEADAEVSMGAAGLGIEVPVEDVGDVAGPRGPGVRARQVDMGNPHLVVLVPAPRPDLLGTWARAVDAGAPAGVNVELVCPTGDGGVDLAVWERGVGKTLACGTGSCAAAAALVDWGMVDLPVQVRNPGGVLRVDCRQGQMVLGGPSRRVAELQVDPATLSLALDRQAP